MCGVAPASRWDRQSRVTAVSGGVLGALLLGMATVPLPYVVQSPGPTVDTLGTVGDMPVIQVSGTNEYPVTAGELRLTTVSELGGPGKEVRATSVLDGWVRGDSVVLPREEALPDATRQQLSEILRRQMESSQRNASAAALQQLGWEVPMTLTVADVMEASNARGLLEAGDVITSVSADGRSLEIADFRDLTDFLAATGPGTAVTLGIERQGGAHEEATFATVARPDGLPGSLLGVLVDTEFTLPVDIEFDINNIGGPSAGLMFSLAIVDLLTPGDLTGGQVVAGTGTMAVDGAVGPISGIRQKMHGAVRDGAHWFLAPATNCPEVVGHIPAGLQVFAVDDLGEAVGVVEGIAAGETAQLPRCPG